MDDAQARAEALRLAVKAAGDKGISITTDYDMRRLQKQADAFYAYIRFGTMTR